MTSSNTLRFSTITSAVSRRTALRGLGGAGMATALGLAAPSALRASETASATMIEPNAGTWKTWILASGDQLRPEAPPDEAATQAELARLQDMAADRDATALERISYWDAGSPGYRWNEVAMQETVRAGLDLLSYRLMALVNVAIYDATIAAWDAKYAYNRVRPALADAGLSTVIATPNSPSYPDEHAVTAGAAAAVLSAIFPDQGERFNDMATEAADSRVMAGVAYPSDTAAGLALGKQVGDLVAARAAADGSDGVFDLTTLPTGPGLWTGDPLNDPIVALWKPWLLRSADQFRPDPPPAWDSPERAEEVAEVRNYDRDNAPFTELWFWPQDPAGRPAPDSAPFTSTQAVLYYAPLVHYIWGPELSQKLFEYRWDTNAPRSARAYALVSISCYDSTIACWEAKFFYMTPRPAQFDSTITTVIPTYAIPDYPSGHATGLASTAEVLSYLFPADEQFFQSRAEENAASRIWAGIHFRTATEAGLKLGREVGDAVIAWADADGSA